MGENTRRWMIILENHGSQKTQGKFIAVRRQISWEQCTSKGQWEVRQQCGHAASQLQLQYRGVKSETPRPGWYPLLFWSCHLPAPFPHLQNGDENSNYLREFLLVLKGKSLFTVWSRYQRIKEVWVPIISHTVEFGSCVIIIRVLV